MQNISGIADLSNVKSFLLLITARIYFAERDLKNFSSFLRQEIVTSFDNIQRNCDIIDEKQYSNEF